MDISRSALVSYSALDMFRLVRDVPSYPEFLSWCEAVEIHEQSEELQVATLTVAVGAVRQQFTTRNRLVRGERLTLNLVEGPFKSLSGEWRFRQLGEEGSRISLHMNFEMDSMLISSAFNRGFSRIADRMVKDFCARADEVYGQ